eukprot:7658817-Pyramimonas_sp.AAC.1
MLLSRGYRPWFWRPQRDRSTGTPRQTIIPPTTPPEEAAPPWPIMPRRGRIDYECDLVSRVGARRAIGKLSHTLVQP